MANLRILYNNVADSATITASTTASGFAGSNMQNAQKTSVHRSTGNTVTYTLTWSSLQAINGIALPATNLKNNDSITVEIFPTYVGIPIDYSVPVSVSVYLQRYYGVEGNVFGFNVKTIGIPTNTILWWNIDFANSTASAEDFEEILNGTTLTTTNGAFAIVEDYVENITGVGLGSFQIKTKQDSTAETLENFRVTIRTGSVSGPIIATTNFSQIYDSTPSPVPSIVINNTACLNRNMLLQNGVTSSDYTQFGFGGATKTSLWFDTTYYTPQIKITLNSSTSGNTFIDCARIVCGEYWEPTRQVDKGIELGFTDQSEIITTRSGNTYVDRKPITETMSFQLQYLGERDRQQFMKIMRSWGSTGLVYVCVFPDNTNPELTQAYSIYGRLQANALQYQFFNYYSSSVQLTSW